MYGWLAGSYSSQLLQRHLQADKDSQKHCLELHDDRQSGLSAEGQETGQARSTCAFAQE